MKKELKNFLLIVMLITTSFIINAQNLNNPNKPGPLGTQVNTFTGNLFIPRTDIFIPARGFDIDISFYYNSFLFDEDFGYGRGWSFQYEIRYSTDTSNNKLILWGDGREDIYVLKQGGGYKSPRGFFSTLAEYQTNKFLITEPDGRKFYFDDTTHKKLTRLEEPNGNYISFTYVNNLLTSLTNTAGQAITFTYDSKNRLATVVDAIANPSRTFTYSYDAIGNLKEVTDPLGNKQRYTYLVNGPMKTITDKNGNTVDIIYFSDFSTRELIGCNKRMSFSYDTTYKISVVTDHLEGGVNQVTKYTYEKVENLSWMTSISGNCCGFNMTYEFDEHGNEIKMIDANGNIYEYTYDERGNMLTAKDPLGQQSTYTYSTDFNKITSYVDAKGNTYTLIYDAAGNLTQLNAPENISYAAAYNSNGDIISSTDPEGNTFTYNYDAYGNPVNVAGPNGYNATLAFDARGNLLAYTDANGNTSGAEYDILDRLKKITDPLNKTTQYNYDAAGNLTSLIDKSNQIVEYNYDASNRVVKVTGPTGKQVNILYDGLDNILAVKNSLGDETNFSYDKLNRLINIKDALDNSASVSYDGNGNVTALKLPNGQSKNYTYDKLDRLTSVSDNNGIISSFTYDAEGNVTSYTNGTGAKVSAHYDENNRIIKFTDPLGNTFLYSYDKNDNVTSVTDRNGFTSNYTYDDLDRVITYTDNIGGVINVSYDSEGNITELKDQNNNATAYTYDNLNRLKKTSYPDGNFIELNYDDRGNVISKKLTDGSVIAFEYDALNRVTHKTLPDGHVFNYSYDDMGRVITAANNSGIVSITYDALGRITSETFDGRTTEYTYDIAGRTQTTTYPDGTEIVKEFDARNQLLSISKNNENILTYSYNNSNQVVTKNYANGISENYQYDIANRLNSISTGGVAIQNKIFSYDNEGNKLAINNLSNPSLSEQFTYDNNYRLIDFKRGTSGSPVLHNTYTYDAVGNRISSNSNGIGITYSINNLNQITGLAGAQNATLSYDGNGNLTYDGRFYKFYDAGGRLRKDSSVAIVINYEYDALGRRVKKNINGNILKYSYSGLAQIEERDAANLLVNKNVFENFLTPVLLDNGIHKYFYHSNELNSVEAITSLNGGVTESYRYDVYGQPSIYDGSNNLISNSSVNNRFAFTGQEWDSTTSNLKFHYRNYSPQLGIFNQRDLIGYEDGMGMYQYVGNNPANGIDILGLENCDQKYKRTEIGITVSVGGLAAGQIKTRAEKSANKWDKTAAEYQAEADKVKWNRADRRRHKHGIEPRAEIKNQQALDQKASNSKAKSGKSKSNAGKAKFAGGLMNAADNAVKLEAFASSLVDGQSNEQYTQEIQAGGDLALSALGWTPVGTVFNTADFAVGLVTGKGITTHTAEAGEFWGDYLYNDASERDREAYKWAVENGKGEQWLETQARMKKRQEEYLMRKKCPEGGTRKPRTKTDPVTGKTTLIAPRDPNEIIGPEGEAEKKWVSIKDRMAYTILFENHIEASAPAKYVRVSTPIEPKQDAATFELGHFGFNNLSFDVPAGQASYYQRLDCRDSMNLYVDVIAGFDQMNNEAFWEFHSIDPITLLPTEEPLAGFLYLRDSLNLEYGHGFVTFSIKPLASSVTLDTIGARADIVFDVNDTIPTNIYTNTIDAFAPSSNMNTLAPAITNPVALSWGGSDDAGGSGIKTYTLYVSHDGTTFNVFSAGMTSTDTSFYAAGNTMYHFFVQATDSVGNIEALKNVPEVTVHLPMENITFSGKVFLQGAFNTATGTMNNSLNTAGILESHATEQPYTGAPFNYNGDESVDAGFFAAHTNIVDWVLIELRDASDPSTIYAKRAAFVLQDGTLVDTNGVSTNIVFEGLAPASYHVAIRHRNHLAIRTASPLDFALGNAEHDFTTGSDKVYQNQSYTSTVPMNGVWVMRGGNADKNNNVKYNGPGNDQNRILNNVLGGSISFVVNNVYASEDVNMNGSIKWNGPGNDQNSLLNVMLGGYLSVIFFEQL